MAEVEPFEYMFDQTTRLIRTAGGLSDEYFGGFTPDSLAAAACDESELGSATLNAYMVGGSQIGAALDFVSGMLHLCRPQCTDTPYSPRVAPLWRRARVPGGFLTRT